MKTKPITSAQTRHLDLKLAAIVAAIVIAAVMLIGYRNFSTVHTLTQYQYKQEPYNVLNFLAYWDAPDYIHIAHYGYENNFWVNWFPLYPALIVAAHYVIPSWLDAALAISWACLVGSVYFYIKIARRLFDLEGALEPLRAVFFFVMFPTAVFLVAPFSEGPMAFLMLLATWLALHRKWLSAGLVAMMASAIHVTGVFVAILVACILWEERVDMKRAAGSLVIGSLGLVAYMAFLYKFLGNPLAFIESQQIFHHWTQKGYLNLITSISLTNVLSVGLVALAAWYWWRKRRSLSVYSLLFLTIPILGKQYGGFDRYVLMAFPIPLMIYGYLRYKPHVLPYATAATAIAWTVTVLQYTSGYIGS